MAKPAPISGLLTPHVGLGEMVATGQRLATIVNLFTSERVVISAPHCGVVHALNLRGKVSKGDDVVGLLELAACDKVGEPILKGTHVRFNRDSSKVRVRESVSLIRQRGEFDGNLSLSLKPQAPPERVSTGIARRDDPLIGKPR